MFSTCSKMLLLLLVLQWFCTFTKISPKKDYCCNYSCCKMGSPRHTKIILYIPKIWGLKCFPTLQCLWHNCCFTMSSASVSSKKGLLTTFFLLQNWFHFYSHKNLFLLAPFSNLDFCWSYIALSDIPRHGKTEKTEGSEKKKYSVAILLIDSLSQLSLTRWWGSGFCSPWISFQNVLIL